MAVKSLPRRKHTTWQYFVLIQLLLLCLPHIHTFLYRQNSFSMSLLLPSIVLHKMYITVLLIFIYLFIFYYVHHTMTKNIYYD